MRVDRKDLQDLSKVRLREARSLLSVGLYDGAYYLAGYSVECALKACIAKGTRRYEFPDKKKVDSSYTHNFHNLIGIAGLAEKHFEQTRSDPDFRKNWEVVQSWSEESRYRRHRPDAAEKLLGAIGDRSHGVISWIKLQW
jgi:HEPN domain-containing protein